MLLVRSPLSQPVVPQAVAGDALRQSAHSFVPGGSSSFRCGYPCLAGTRETVGTSSVNNLSSGSSIVQILFYLCFIVYCHYLLCLSFIVTITLTFKVIVTPPEEPAATACWGLYLCFY